MIFIPIPLPETALQASSCNALLRKLFLQAALGMGGYECRSPKVPHPGPVDDLPDEVALEAFKYCVEDTQTGQRWYELPEYRDPSSRPCLSICTDRVPDMVSACAFLTGHLRMRMFWLFDRFHDKWNSVEKAVRRAGMYPLLMDILHVVNLFQGPWNSASWFKQLLETWESWLQGPGATSELWHALGERIAEDKDWPSDDLLDRELCAARLASLADSQAFSKNTTRTKLRTWFSVIARLDEFAPDWHLVLLALCHMLVELGVFQDADDMPIWGVCPRGWGPAADTEGSLDEARRKCRNSLHLACMILGNLVTNRRAMVLLEVTRPMWSSFTKMEQGMKDEESALNYFIGFSRGAYSGLLKRVWAVARNPARLRKMKFPLGFDGLPKVGLKSKRGAAAQSSSSSTSFEPFPAAILE